MLMDLETANSPEWANGGHIHTRPVHTEWRSIQNGEQKAF